MKIMIASGIFFLYLKSALNLDFQNDVFAFSENLVNRRLGSAVIVAGVLRVFQHFAGRDLFFKLFSGEVVVMHTVDLAGSWGSCGGRDGKFKGGKLTHTGNDGSLAASRRAGNDEK